MPSTRLPVALPPLVCMNGEVATNVTTQVLPPSPLVGGARTSEASVGFDPSLAPLPPVLRRDRDSAPVAMETGRSKVSVSHLTCDRWAEPSPTVIDCSTGAGAATVAMIAPE